MSAALRDVIIGRSIVLEAFKKHCRQKIADKLARRLTSLVRAKLESVEDWRTISAGHRKRLFKAALRRWYTVSQDLDTVLNKVVVSEVEWLIQTTNRLLPGLPIGGSVANAQSRFWKMPIQGMLMKEWVDRLFNQFQEALNHSLILMRRIADDLDQLVASVNSGMAKFFTSFGSLASTAISYAAAAAREEVYQTNRSLIQSLQFVSLLDIGSRPECARLDQSTVPIHSPLRPPFHFGCRVMTVPLLKTWREMGYQHSELPLETREELNEATPLAITYGTWLAKQSREMQDIVLGHRRAEMYRNGKLKVSKFDTKFLKPIDWAKVLEMRQL